MKQKPKENITKPKSHVAGGTLDPANPNPSQPLPTQLPTQKPQTGDKKPNPTQTPPEENITNKPNPQVAGGTLDPANPNPSQPLPTPKPKAKANKPNLNQTTPPKPPQPSMPTPKRKRNQTTETPMKIPRLSTNPNPKLENPKLRKLKPTRNPPNPHPQRNQQIFLKIDKEIHLIKHRGLATSSRNLKKPKILEPTQETNPTHPDQPTQENQQKFHGIT